MILTFNWFIFSDFARSCSTHSSTDESTTESSVKVREKRHTVLESASKY